jgi:hypothetical protein
MIINIILYIFERFLKSTIREIQKKMYFKFQTQALFYKETTQKYVNPSWWWKISQ